MYIYACRCVRRKERKRMRYTGENCPYCGMEFTEQDDVVVCPECATPHHRVCWFAHGECANAPKHTEGFVWKKAEEPRAQEPAQPEQNTQHIHTHTQQNLDIICPDCGHTCPNGTLRCPECGAVLIPFANPMGEPPVAQFRPGFDHAEEIGNVKAGDIALYCRTAGASYIKKFRNLSLGGKFTFNWAALFFTPYWFFYRKLYKAGAVFAALFVAIGIWLIPATQTFYEVYENISVEVARVMEADGEEAAFKVMEKRSPELTEAMKPVIIPTMLQWLIKLVGAFVADRLYYKKACTDIIEVRSRSTDERSVQLELFRRGGTNILIGAGTYLAYDILIYAASYLMTLL